MSHRHTNRLIHETSPYLQQHAHNPVDWHPWGEEALTRARNENKPILLSIGYSACHWCHVMERESFENEEIAALMNAHFVNIKVDREERPDLDQVYQNAVQLFGRNGGWPLTMFLTPEGHPFFGGTYFPPEDRYGMAGFPQVLSSVAAAYRDRQGEIRETSREVLQALARHAVTSPPSGKVLFDPEAVAVATARLSRFYDPGHGGFGSAPKFPNSMALTLFLRHHRRTREADPLEVVTHTLRRMAEGGIYDQIGGGFHRYSVDDRWLVPHFEKMLYDNALLSRLYIEMYQMTGDPLFRRVAEETLDYVLREMQSPEGGFYSTQDADSEGEEGKYFVWTPEEVRRILGDEDGAIFCRRYDVTGAGNFEGKNILHVDRPLKAMAVEFSRSEEELEEILKRGREKLRAAREARIKPFRDEKILTGWNGLMISGFAAVGGATGNAVYIEGARKSADFVLSRLQREGRLLRVFKDGRARLEGYLDDYAFFTAALLDLFEATFEERYLDAADELTRTLIDLFRDETDGGFFFTGRGHEALIHRPKTGYDHAIPGGNAVTAMNLFRLAIYRDNPVFREMGEALLRLYQASVTENPFGFAAMLAALDFHMEGAQEIVVVGDRKDNGVQEILSGIRGVFLPNRVLYLIDPSAPPSRIPEFARGKETGAKIPSATVCRNFTCSQPVGTWEKLEELLTTAR